jgi:hypothetical protein
MDRLSDRNDLEQKEPMPKMITLDSLRQCFDKDDSMMLVIICLLLAPKKGRI